MPDAIAQFADAKYLSLESFRKTGVGVRTPVWFAQDSGLPSRIALAQEGMEEPRRGPDGGSETDPATCFYVYSAPDSGKVKRIRNNRRVRVAPCSFRGDPLGEWVEGQARFCTGDEAAHGQELLHRKYGFLKIVGDFFSRLRGRSQTIIAIEVS